jgi:MYXO-CTERM domain-containing protein
MTKIDLRLLPSLLSLALLAALAVPAAQAASLTVDPSAADDATAGDGKCSLREAVLSVNAGANVGDCVATVLEAYGSNDTINLPAGVYTLTRMGLDETYVDTAPGNPNSVPTVSNVGDATMGDLDLSKSVKIIGAGAGSTTIAWSSDAAVVRDRIFHVNAATGTVAVSLQGLTLNNGQTQETIIKIGPTSTYGLLPTLYYLRRAGGALAVGPAAAVVLADPNKTGQASSEGRGGSKKPGTTGEEGGATLTLEMKQVTVSGNSAQGDGGGIYTAAALTASELLVADNSASTNGGGIYNEGNTAITGSTIRDNTAEGGGGFFGTGSNVVNFSAVTISGNKAVGGGGISGRSGVTLRLVNTTISANIGSDTGGGLYTNGAAELRFVTIARNLAGADASTAGSGINTFPSSSKLVTMKNVLLADNRKGYTDGMTAAEIAALPSANCGSTGTSLNVASRGFNLSSDGSCQSVLNLAGDQNAKDAKIGDLADNGGGSLTHALLPNSPALGAGQAEADIQSDQRGETRDATPDIGAFEVPSAVVTSTDTTDTTVSGSSGGGCTVNPDAGFDPGLPALVLAALGGLWLRRRRQGRGSST